MKGDLPASNQLQSKEEAEKASRNLDAEIQADLEANIDNWLSDEHPSKDPELTSQQKAEEARLKDEEQARQKAEEARLKEEEEKEKSLARKGATVPTKPQDWDSLVPVSADVQKPPKQRGRKPKAKAQPEQEEGTEKVGSKQKRKQSKLGAEPSSSSKHRKEETKVGSVAGRGKRKAQDDQQEQAKERATKRKKEDKEPKPAQRGKKPRAVLEDALANGSFRATPKAKANAVKAEAKAHSNKQSKGYESLQIEGTGSKEEAWDAYALASAACAVHELGRAEQVPEKAPPSVVDPALAKKKLLSRQSCAYKKELRILLKQGMDMESAKEGARKALRLR